MLKIMYLSTSKKVEGSLSKYLDSVCGKDDQRHSIVLNVKNIHLFAYFGVSLDLYDNLLLSCSNEYFYPVARDIVMHINRHSFVFSIH